MYKPAPPPASSDTRCQVTRTGLEDAVQKGMTGAEDGGSYICPDLSSPVLDTFRSAQQKVPERD